MPQTTPERAARWPGMDTEALEFLKENGFTLSRDWEWSHPEKKSFADLSEREADAIIYLIEEWDYGGFRGSASMDADEVSDSATTGE